MKLYKSIKNLFFITKLQISLWIEGLFDDWDYCPNWTRGPIAAQGPGSILPSPSVSEILRW